MGRILGRRALRPGLEDVADQAHADRAAEVAHTLTPALSRVREREALPHQMETRSSGARYIASPGFTPKVA
jgi:hypothetical protein